MKVGDLIMFVPNKDPNFNSHYFQKDMEAMMVFKIISTTGDKVSIEGIGFDGKQIESNLVSTDNMKVVTNDRYCQLAFENGISRRDAKAIAGGLQYGV